MSLADDISFDADVLALLATYGHVNRATALDAQGDSNPAMGATFKVKDGGEAERVINDLQPKLMPRGYRAFWSERHKPNGLKDSDEIVVLKTSDPYAIVALRSTAGWNYNVSHDDVLARLRTWEGLCQFDVVGASGDWVAIVFRTLPQDICAFAEEVYLFCPDTVEQGVIFSKEDNTRAAVKEAEKLCPKLSAAFSEKLAEQNVNKTDIPVPPALRELLQGHDVVKEAEQGVKILARALRRTKQLFLWWD